MPDRPDVLLVDDERSILLAVRRALRESLSVSIETTTDPREALATLRERPPKVLVTDLVMPAMSGIDVLREARRVAPDTVRILLTAQTDLQQAVDAVNTGRIFRYVGKPWENEVLSLVVLEAVEAHDSTARRRQSYLDADRERQNLRQIVESVADIQRSILPAGKLRLPDADAAFLVTPYEHATGDYVDTITLPRRRIALILGDVCGHGIGAALSVFTARALLRSGLTEGGALPEVVSRVNRFLCSDMVEGRFLTLFAGIYDPEEDSLTYVNAGQVPPLVLGTGGVRELKPSALPLGIVGESAYERLQVEPLLPGETLFACTDGLTEARNGEEEFFGPVRLVDLLARHRDLAPFELLGEVRAAALAFAGRPNVGDDLALLAFRPRARTASAGQALQTA